MVESGSWIKELSDRASARLIATRLESANACWKAGSWKGAGGISSSRTSWGVLFLCELERRLLALFGAPMLDLGLWLSGSRSEVALSPPALTLSTAVVSPAMSKAGPSLASTKVPSWFSTPRLLRGGEASSVLEGVRRTDGERDRLSVGTVPGPLGLMSAPSSIDRTGTSGPAAMASRRCDAWEGVPVDEGCFAGMPLPSFLPVTWLGFDDELASTRLGSQYVGERW